MAIYFNGGKLGPIISSQKIEELRGECSLDFEMPLYGYRNDIDGALGTSINLTTVFDIKDIVTDNTHNFRINFINYDMDNNGNMVVKVEADHVSCVLSDPEYDLEPYDEEENPTGFATMTNMSARTVLTAILAGVPGVPITWNSAASTTFVTYGITSKTNRRQMFMDVLEQAQIPYGYTRTGFILDPKGSGGAAVYGENIVTLSKQQDARTRIIQTSSENDGDGDNEVLTTYECELLDYPESINEEDGAVNFQYKIGNNVSIRHPEFGINVSQQVIKIESEPGNDYMPRKVTLGRVTYRTMEDALENEVDDSEGPQGPPGPAGPKGPPGESIPMTEDDRSTIQNIGASEQIKCWDDDRITIKSGGTTFTLNLDPNTSVDGDVVLKSKLTGTNLLELGPVSTMFYSEDATGSSIKCNDDSISLMANGNSYDMSFSSDDMAGSCLTKKGDTIVFKRLGVDAKTNIRILTELPDVADVIDEVEEAEEAGEEILFLVYKKGDE